VASLDVAVHVNDHDHDYVNVDESDVHSTDLRD
jgi:hypothetical protein